MPCDIFLTGDQLHAIDLYEEAITASAQQVSFSI